MKIKRRTFLQGAGFGLLSLGIGDFSLVKNPKLTKYYQTLAEPTTRKLALLIGINNYGSFPSLKGCLTDVELQRELLIHRFGFQPQDIITLTNKSATRNQIETTFNEHLIKQAKSGDVVVFHFSGYGSQVNFPDLNNPDNEQLVNSLVPVDSNNRDLANDILLTTLALLGRSLLTNKLTMVFDTSFQANESLNKGILLGRSLNLPPANNLNPDELSWLTELINNNTLERQKSNKQQSVFPGIRLISAQENQVAREMELKGTSAGLFTYYLSQYLWQISTASTIQTTYQIVNSQIEKITNNTQSCQLIGNSQSAIFTYYLLPEQQEGAEGIITKLEDKNIVKVKLLGLPHNLIQNYGINSWLTVLNSAEKLQIQSQFGLNFSAKVEGETTNLVGKFVQEWIRMIPKNISLTVALDSELSRIEKVDSTSAFSVIDAVSLVVNKGEQFADCIFTKTNGQNYQILDINGVSLPNTLGVANEAVKLAVKRLESNLNNLLAAKIWNLTINNNSSCLGVKVSLETIEPDKQTILQLQTKRYSPNSLNSNTQSSSLNSRSNTLKTGTKIQYRLENYSNDSLYFLLVGINSKGHPFSIYLPENPEDFGLISPSQTVIFPEPEQAFDWRISGREGITQTTIIFSKAPFQETLTVLGQMKQFQGGVEKLLEISDPVKVANSLLEDLDTASAVSRDLGGSNPEFYALDVHNWASFSLSYSISKSN